MRFLIFKRMLSIVNSVKSRTSADYKRNDKRAAAVEAIKRALETQFAEETFTKRKLLPLRSHHFVTPSCLVAKPLITITAIFVVCISLHLNRGDKSHWNRRPFTHAISGCDLSAIKFASNRRDKNRLCKRALHIFLICISFFANNLFSLFRPCRHLFFQCFHPPSRKIMVRPSVMLKVIILLHSSCIDSCVTSALPFPPDSRAAHRKWKYCVKSREPAINRA